MHSPFCTFNSPAVSEHVYLRHIPMNSSGGARVVQRSFTGDAGRAQAEATGQAARKLLRVDPRGNQDDRPCSRQSSLNSANKSPRRNLNCIVFNFALRHLMSIMNRVQTDSFIVKSIDIDQSRMKTERDRDGEFGRWEK